MLANVYDLLIVVVVVVVVVDERWVALGTRPTSYPNRPVSACIDTLLPNEQHMDKIDQLSASQRAELEDRVKSEMLRQAFQDLVQRVTEKCFEKCVTKPSSSLTSGEQTCLAKCVDRYIEAMGVVSKAMVERQQRS
ncbi:Timm13p [Cyanidiococcus yangmingshanensis]|uniref:Mitochondrial import inner membrane translocase subunit n=1 Tax=Cyanidiococcus yangmingshanensis TaxID=2690220 RepID=A0A7J7IBY5_9RHOD|nr:Timm13p [Cyanidiococcus yangmingshanensis]